MSDETKQLPTPDEYTNDWYRQQFGSMRWQLNQVQTVLVDELQKATHTATALRKEVNELRQARERDSARIGELQERLDGHEKRLDKASDYLKTMKTKEVAK